MNDELFFFIFTEDFNKKILNPDLSESDLIYLHNDLKILYKNYCSSDGSDRINFEENIINELKEGRFDILFPCIIIVVAIMKPNISGESCITRML